MNTTNILGTLTGPEDILTFADLVALELPKLLAIYDTHYISLECDNGELFIMTISTKSEFTEEGLAKLNKDLLAFIGTTGMLKIECNVYDETEIEIDMGVWGCGWSAPSVRTGLTFTADEEAGRTYDRLYHTKEKADDKYSNVLTKMVYGYSHLKDTDIINS